MNEAYAYPLMVCLEKPGGDAAIASMASSARWITKARCWKATTKIRDKAAVLRFMKKVLNRDGSPAAITTDGFRSYKAAMTELGNADRQEVRRYANNRAENGHLPLRRRERAMLRLRQMKSL